MTMNERTRRVVRVLTAGTAVLCLVGAGISGVWFGAQTMDLVLLQLVFYGAWACIVGAFVGGTLGAAIEEDACGELDMGTTSSMGAILGTLSAGLLGTAVTGLAFFAPWTAVWAGVVGVGVLHLVLWRVWPWRLVRTSHLDARGWACDANGRPLPEERQPLRMRDRMAVLLTASVLVMLGLTLAMAGMMGSDLGHPVMMAPMMYGMFGTMLGGMLGGWLAGLLDEHRGALEHENPVMVGSMALMAGMMGGMPSGMLGGMMAVMGLRAIGVTIGGGLLLLGLFWALAVRGRYRFERRTDPVPTPEPVVVEPADVVGSGSLLVGGMTCGACVAKVQRGVSAVAGVAAVEVDLASGRIELRWSRGFAGMERVQTAIRELGYDVRS
jgi:copper chaperone